MAEEINTGRGRPRQQREVTPNVPRAPRQPTDKVVVDRAVASMNNFYALITTVLLFVDLPKTIEQWEDVQDTLEASNREALESSPKLAAQLAKVGEGTGALAFITGNAMAIVPLVRTAQKEMSAKRADRNTDAEHFERQAPPQPGTPAFAAAPPMGM